MWHAWLKSLKVENPKALRAYQRLLLAVCVSAVLHAILFGKLHIALPNFSAQTSVIEARIVLPKKVLPEKALPEKVAVAPISTPEPEPAPTPEPVKPAEPAPQQQVAPTTLPEPPTENPPIASAPINPLPAEPLPQEPLVEAKPTLETQPVPPADTTPVTSEPSVIDEPLVLNKNAYRYVEVHYQVSTKIDGPSQGKSSIVFDSNEQNTYHLTWKTEPSGLVAMFVDDLVQTSSGKLTNRGLQPLQYEYHYGDNSDKTHIATFDWVTKKVALQSAKDTKVVDLPNDTQDILSFMFQFMYVAPLEVMRMHLVTGKKLGDYQYVFEGEETINTGLSNLKTVHIGRTGDDGDSKTELWLAVEYQNLPVKIRKTEKNGKVYEFVISQIVTTRPPPIMP